MLITILIIIILLIALVFILSIVGGTGIAIAQAKQRSEYKKELASMSTSDLETLLDKLRKEIKDAGTSNLPEMDLMELKIKEGQIILELRKQWQDSLNALSIDELNEEYERMAATPKLLDTENDMRRKALKKVIDERRKPAAAS